jgi:hypothetical protein
MRKVRAGRRSRPFPRSPPVIPLCEHRYIDIHVHLGVFVWGGEATRDGLIRWMGEHKVGLPIDHPLMMTLYEARQTVGLPVLFLILPSSSRWSCRTTSSTRSIGETPSGY